MTTGAEVSRALLAALHGVAGLRPATPLTVPVIARVPWDYDVLVLDIDVIWWKSGSWPPACRCRRCWGAPRRRCARRCRARCGRKPDCGLWSPTSTGAPCTPRRSTPTILPRQTGHPRPGRDVFPWSVSTRYDTMRRPGDSSASRPAPRCAGRGSMLRASPERALAQGRRATAGAVQQPRPVTTVPSGRR